MPFFRRAIEIDANFALAYAVLGLSYASYPTKDEKVFDVSGGAGLVDPSTHNEDRVLRVVMR